MKGATEQEQIKFRSTDSWFFSDLLHSSSSGFWVCQGRTGVWWRELRRDQWSDGEVGALGDLEFDGGDRIESWGSSSSSSSFFLATSRGVDASWSKTQTKANPVFFLLLLLHDSSVRFDGNWTEGRLLEKLRWGHHLLYSDSTERGVSTTMKRTKATSIRSSENYLLCSYMYGSFSILSCMMGMVELLRDFCK